MAVKKIITVFGATGQQGGPVAQIFLSDPKLKDEWAVRAVTRDTSKEPAKKLESQGAEVVAVSCCPRICTHLLTTDHNLSRRPT
jgi:hypothetical protein